MNTDVQDWCNGKRITVGTGGVTEAYACKLNSSGQMVACDTNTDVPCGIADYTAAAAAEGVFWPIGPSQERWVSVSGAVTVGAKLVRATTTGRWSATTSSGAIVGAIALTATAGAGYAKVKFVPSTIHI